MPRFPSLGFTEQRRRVLAILKGERPLDQFESRSMVTPFNVATVGIGLVPALGQLGSTHATGGHGLRGSEVSVAVDARHEASSPARWSGPVLYATATPDWPA